MRYRPWWVPVEDHAHGGSSLGGHKGLPEDPSQHCGQGPVQAVGPGPAQHLHIPLGPACVMVKGLHGEQHWFDLGESVLWSKACTGKQHYFGLDESELHKKSLQGPQLRFDLDEPVS